jgi:2'-5' RNA ligase
MSGPDYPARPRRRRGPKAEAGTSGETLRTFVAVFPSPRVVTALTEVCTRLRPDLPGLRWVAPGNLHFTLRFFGNLTREEIARAKQVLDDTGSAGAPFELELSGLGVFPNWRRPRILWVGSATGQARLEALARILERGFREARLGKADKPFVPHLTLGRWKDSRGVDVERARTACAELGTVGSFVVEEVKIMQSVLSAEGARYTPLHIAPLRGTPPAPPPSSTPPSSPVPPASPNAG